MTDSAERPEIRLCRARRRRPREHQQVLNQIVEPIDAGDDFLDDRGIVGARRQARANHLYRAAHRRERVLHFVRDHRRHLAEPGQRRRLAQLILELGAPRQIVQDAGEVLLAVDLELAHRQVQRELLAVAAQPGDGAADADDPALAGLEVMPDVAVVLRSIGLGHQHADVLAEHVGFAVTEHLLGGMVERLDAAARIDHDDAVDGRVDHRAPACVGNAQRVDGRLVSRRARNTHRGVSLSLRPSPAIAGARNTPRCGGKSPPLGLRRARDSGQIPCAFVALGRWHG